MHQLVTGPILLCRFELKMEPSDWTDMVNALSHCLTCLTLDEISAYPDDEAAWHLTIFNQFQQLQCMKVCYGSNVDDDEDFGYEGCQMAGDLKLPHLHELEIRVTWLKPLIAPALTFDHIPLSCHIVCELEVRTRAARKRLGPKKKKKRAPRRWMLATEETVYHL